jgi:outer membrane protein assembly factor BamB
LKEPLELAWIYEAGESIESSAAIVDGVVYVGSQSGELLALELETGELRWKYQATEAIGESSPAVSDGVVYVGDLAGVLHAVEVKSGAGLWTFESEAEIRSSPVVVDGKVLFGSYDGHLYAVSARTGKLLWKRVTEGPVHSTASVAQGMAHIAGCDGYFRAIRVADGKEVFQVLAGAYTGASPPLVSGRTYFGTFDNEVLGVDLSRQQVIWRYELQFFGGGNGRQSHRWGTRQDGTRVGCQDGRRDLELQDPRAGRLFAGCGRRQSLRWLP